MYIILSLFILFFRLRIDSRRFFFLFFSSISFLLLFFTRSHGTCAIRSVINRRDLRGIRDPLGGLLQGTVLLRVASRV